MKVCFYQDCLMQDMETTRNCRLDRRNAMSIVVKLVSFLSDAKTIELQGMKSYDTLWNVKVLVDMKETITPNQQILIHNGSKLEDHTTLAANKVENGSILYVFVSPMGPNLPKQNGSKMMVKVPGWKPVTVEVLPWYTARHVKALMESLTGLIIFDNKFLLKHGRKILYDDDCIDLFHNELPIYLVLKPGLANRELDLVITWLEQGRLRIDIRVSGNGWEEYLYVSKLSTVYDVKKMIEKVADIGLNQQTLFHKKNMARLDEDDKTLGFYALDEGSELYVLGLSPKFTIKIPQVRDIVSLKAQGIKYVSDIKDGIFEKLGIPHSSQNLVYQGQFLEDSQILQANDIEENSVVYGIIGSGDQTKEVFLDIMYFGMVYCDIKVKQWCTILDVKTIIESQIGLPVCVQELVHQHQKLKDWEHLSDYNFENMDKVHLKLRGSPVKLIINVADGGEGHKNNDNIVLEARNTDTIREILSRIPEEEMEKIYGQPCLFHHNNNPLLGNKMLAQYGINLSRCILSLDKLVQINVTGADGITTNVNLKPSCDIKTVKQKIEQTCGIPYELQRLTYLDDDELEYEAEDTLTLAHYEATLGSLWDLRWKFGGRSWSFFWPSYRGDILGAEQE